MTERTCRICGQAVRPAPHRRAVPAVHAVSVSTRAGMGTAAAGDARPLPDVRAPDPAPHTGGAPAVLSLLVPHGSRTPARAVGPARRMMERLCRICGRSFPAQGTASPTGAVGCARCTGGAMAPSGRPSPPGRCDPPPVQSLWPTDLAAGRGWCDACYVYWRRPRPAPAGPAPSAPLSDLRPARAAIPPRAVQSLLPVLASDGPRTPARPAAARARRRRAPAATVGA